MFQVTHCSLSGHCDYLLSAIMYASVTVIVGNCDCHSFQCDFHTINNVCVCVSVSMLHLLTLTVLNVLLQKQQSSKVLAHV